MSKQLSDLELMEQEFVDALNEQGTVVICGITFDRSDILREMDPTAYRVMLADFLDAMGVDLD